MNQKFYDYSDLSTHALTAVETVVNLLKQMDADALATMILGVSAYQVEFEINHSGEVDATSADDLWLETAGRILRLLNEQNLPRWSSAERLH